MRASLILLLLAAVTGCSSNGGAADAGVDAGRARPLLHSHNDYEHARPLLDALDHGFDSVEADLMWLDGQLKVTHTGASVKGTLRELYLEPLRQRLAAHGGSVHGDGRPLYLWLDTRDTSEPFRAALAQQLSEYDFISTFSNEGPDQERAVVVILTGNDSTKRAMVDLPAPRSFTRDSNTYDQADPPADGKWRYYALNFAFTVFWDGSGDIPPTQLRNFRAMVDGAHQKGRAVRFWAAPETPSYWQLATDNGVDFVGTDKLAELKAFMDGYAPAP